jgi:hypothetical protein
MSEPAISAGGVDAQSAANAQQFGRTCTLLVSNSAGQALDLSQLRIKFSIKKSGIMTPNTAQFYVYNMDRTTAAIIRKEFTHVVFQAGYVGNYGVVFKGNIKWSTIGRENATDTFLNILAGDGDGVYNYSIVNQTLAAGSSPTDRLNTALTSMYNMGLTKTYVGILPQNQLPRGKVMYGNARDVLKGLADTNNFTWSIQDGGVVFVSSNSYLPGTATVLTSKTGMVGTPEQTILGIDCKCLLNPKLKIHGRAKIDNRSVKAFQLQLNVPGSPENTPVPLTYDGMYYISVAEHDGDTRGNDWYTHLQLLDKPPSTNPLNNQSLGG